MEKVLFSWSGGKDSAMALLEILTATEYQVTTLLTTVSEDYERISMHGVRRTLLAKQAESLGLKLEEVRLPGRTSTDVYEQIMGRTLEAYKAIGVSAVVFGDISLEDVRAYREQNLARIGMRAIFPLWKRDARGLMQSFLGSGFKAVTVCVDTQALSADFVGRRLDASFVAELPASVDVCGENGEYHTFVSDGPIFRQAIPHRLGETVLREQRFCYCDLMPL